MKQIHGKLVQESWDSQRNAGRYNPADVFIFEHPKFGRCKAVIGSGESDHVTFWLKDDILYVVSVNYRMGYCGVDHFEFSQEKKRVDYINQYPSGLFCQSEESYSEILGRRGLGLADRTIAKRLIEALEEATC